jgi:NAD(P)-dependent dehydrogenase (short-subunit alcohol dehydrogenase family)
MNLRLTGKRVLITAGAAGIGRAIAEGFAAEGARVHVCDIDAAALAALPRAAGTAHATADANTGAITGEICDVSDRAAVERFVASAAAQLGGLDVLVNNAGIGGPTAALADVDPAAWRQVIEINLLGTFGVTQCALPHLLKSRSASIIVMSSLAGRVGYPNRSAYSTTKWGLIGLTKTLAIELGDAGIRVNAILPGAVNGPRYQAVLEGRARQSGRSVAEEAAHAMRNVSIKKLVEPEQIAALAAFLASDAASTISGQIFPIDGDTQSSA